MSLTEQIAAIGLPVSVVIADVTAASPAFSWTQTLLVYGPLGLWVAWFVIRDRLDREERKQDRLDQERRHLENLAAQKSVENALRTTTNAMILTLTGIKHLDATVSELMLRVKEDNDSSGGGR